ncbi:NAD-dependent glutamate dehydrogenase [Orobanche minor]
MSTREALSWIKKTDPASSVNASPYENGWIIKVEVKDAEELNTLMDADQYSKFCEEEDANH